MGGIWEPNREAAGRAGVLSIVFLIIASNTKSAHSMLRRTRVGTNRAQVKCNHWWQEEEKKKKQKQRKGTQSGIGLQRKQSKCYPGEISAPTKKMNHFGFDLICRSSAINAAHRMEH